LQFDTCDSVEPVHVWIPQETVVAVWAHAPAPLHSPVFPHGALGVQALSALPAATLAQVPKLPATLHD
jgi:hypothetical protein